MVILGWLLWAASAWAAPQGHTLTVEGHTLHAVEAGDPSLPPVLFVHGSPGDWHAWSAYLQREDLLARAHLIAIDRPGYGGSEPGRAEGDMDVQARVALAALALNRSGRPAVLVGHSLGGPIIARAAMLAPEQVAGLVFLAPSIDPQEEHWRVYNRLATLRWVQRLISPDLVTSNEEIHPFKAQLQAWLPQWEDIHAPAVLVQGGKDALVSPKNADFGERMLHDVLVIRIPTANHFIPWTHTDLCLDALRGMLARLGW